MKKITKTNWFEERELPDIHNYLDLLKAFSIVKNRFNGNPHCYTRNDYILFINTVYAAFRDLYYSTHLIEDVTTQVAVGFVKKDEVFKKGTSLQEVVERIFTGEGEPEQPDIPDGPIIEENIFYTNIIKPVGRDYYDSNWDGKSNLQEGIEFNMVQYSSVEFTTTDVMFDKSEFAILPSSEFRNDKLQILSPKPLDQILDKITKHLSSNWSEDPLCSTVDLSIFEFKNMVNVKNAEWYMYELNEDKLPFSLGNDVLIKFIFK